MIYDLLATLWEGPTTDIEAARALAARTGDRFSTQAAGRYLRLLSDCGFARAAGDPIAPYYTITADGSNLLAQLAGEHAILS